MRVGVTTFLTDRTLPPAPFAVAAEERGFASVYFPEHTHIPISRRTPPPTGEDVLDDSYARTLDPFVALSAAGALTGSLRLGTGVALPLQRDPIALAKAVASLDHLTGGRVVLGVGVGWNREEMEDHGVEVATRRARLREHVLCMRALWEHEVASFAGEHVRMEPSWAWPKPVQARVPILLGGAPGPSTFSAIADWGDGWMPVGGAGVAAALPRLRAAMEQAGRDPADLEVVPFGVVPSPGKLDHYRSIGVTEVVLRIPAGGPDVVLPALDAYAGFATPFSRA